MTAQGSVGGGATTAAADAEGGPTPTGSMPDAAPLAEILKGIDQRHVGAAMSKMISASIGDIAMVFSRSPQHKYFTFADIEWMILPAVLAGHIHIIEAAEPETGLRAPIGLITWARVSQEVDSRLAMRGLEGPLRLRPDEWTSGHIYWLMDVIGERSIVEEAIQRLRRGPLKGQDVRVLVAGADGRSSVSVIHEAFPASRTAVKSGAQP